MGFKALKVGKCSVGYGLFNNYKQQSAAVNHGGGGISKLKGMIQKIIILIDCGQRKTKTLLRLFNAKFPTVTK